MLVFGGGGAGAWAGNEHGRSISADAQVAHPSGFIAGVCRPGSTRRARFAPLYEGRRPTHAKLLGAAVHRLMAPTRTHAGMGDRLT
jgi:hypothetical protein